ncbi:MAG: hypothetical protein HS111_30525 [Kofleriaceae bacterium]|nr:hypothetical protein [Kofleriaceae bacterium]
MSARDHRRSHPHRHRARRAAPWATALAHVAALAGHDVRLYDVAQDAADAGRGSGRGARQAAWRWARSRRRRATPPSVAWSPPPSWARPAPALTVVVEAVPEKLGRRKRELFAAVERAAWIGAGALLATNTSPQPVAKIAGAVADPARVVGMHFFNAGPPDEAAEAGAPRRLRRQRGCRRGRAGRALPARPPIGASLAGGPASRTGRLAARSSARPRGDPHGRGGRGRARRHRHRDEAQRLGHPHGVHPAARSSRRLDVRRQASPTTCPTPCEAAVLPPLAAARRSPRASWAREAAREPSTRVDGMPPAPRRGREAEADPDRSRPLGPRRHLGPDQPHSGVTDSVDARPSMRASRSPRGGHQ